MWKAEMYSPAYLGDALCKRQVLERLLSLQKADTWAMRPIYWDGRTGSLVGSLLQGENLDEWERLFGLPKWLALAIDNLFASGPDLKAGLEFGIALLDAIPVGADMRTVGSRVVIELLEGLPCGLLPIVSMHAMTETLISVSLLHRRITDGGDVDAAEWRAVRRRAVAQTDAVERGSVDADVGACIEAATWDPRTSRTAVSDTGRVWIKATSDAEVARQSGWCAHDDERMKALLDRLHADAKAAGATGFIDVFKLLDEKHPEEARQLKAQIALEHACRGAQWRKITDLLLRVATEAGGAVKAA